MSDYSPYAIRKKQIEDEVAAKLAAEEIQNKARYQGAAEGVAQHNASLGPTSASEHQGPQTIEPYEDYRYKIALGNISQAQQRLDEAKAEEERQLSLQNAGATIGKTKADIGATETATAGSQQTQNIIADLRKTGALGMEKGQLTTKGNYELNESEKLEKSSMDSIIKANEKTIEKIDNKDATVRENIINSFITDPVYEGMSEDMIVNSERNKLKIKNDQLKAQYGKDYNEPITSVPATTPEGPGYGKITTAGGQEVSFGAKPTMPVESLQTKVAGATGTLPKGLTEAIIQGNMTKYGKTREEVIAKYKKVKGIK